jgi:hypothetical protein
MAIYLWTEETHIKFLEEHNDEGDTEYFTRLSDNAIIKRSRFYCKFPAFLCELCSNNIFTNTLDREYEIATRI